MPKYRKLYTKTVESLDVNDMPDDFTRLFWVLLPLALCREGRGLDNAAWLKSKLFPLREDIGQAQVYAAFRWCAERGMIETYRVNGRGFFCVPTFRQYQGDTNKEAESDYPSPQVQSESRPTPELVQSKSGTDTTTDATTDPDANATTTTDAGAPAPDVAAVAVVLAGFGMGNPEAVAQEAAGYYVEEVEDLVEYARTNNLKPGWVRSQLRSGHRAPPTPVPKEDDARRFIEGPYAAYVQH